MSEFTLKKCKKISVYYVLRDTQLLMEYFVCVLAKLLRKNVACVDVNRKLLAEP